MKVKVKLFASLAGHLPPGAANHTAELRLEEGTCVQAIIDRLGVPEPLAHLVLINGEFVPREQRPTRALAENDELAVWPPIAGG